jgi:hypothetical protein
MDRHEAARFEAQFAYRIAAKISDLLDRDVHAEVIPGTGAHAVTRVRVYAARSGGEHGYAHPLNLFLTWDEYEIARLFEPDGEARFLRYLEAMSAKLDAWQDARRIDLGSRSQAEPMVLVGGLDFEA